jgi:hypothetical protein
VFRHTEPNALRKMCTFLNAVASVRARGCPGGACSGRAAGASSRPRRSLGPAKDRCSRAGAPRRQPARVPLLDLVVVARVGDVGVRRLAVAELAELARAPRAPRRASGSSTCVSSFGPVPRRHSAQTPCPDRCGQRSLPAFLNARLPLADCSPDTACRRRICNRARLFDVAATACLDGFHTPSRHPRTARTS